jgi:formylglycine-generating enzyme required for sulfatase activity
MDELAKTKEKDSVGKVLKILTDARLVTTEQDSAEVAHEALIREWGTLHRWLDEDRDSLRLHRHLTESAQEWERRGKEASELYRGARLNGMQEWMKEHNNQLSPLEGEFLRASQNVKKQERVRWIAVASVGVVLLVMVIFGVTGKLNPFIYHPVDMEDYWVTIPAGNFLMGSTNEQRAEAKKNCSNCDLSDELPQHEVVLPVYQIGRYEVTNRQYAQCAKAGICAGKAYGIDDDLYPVVNVTWYDAKIYCEWIGGRLPTEAEWDKAASWNEQTKTKSTYPWGEVLDCSYANYSSENSSCVGKAMPVGSYESGKSPYSLYDMGGNILEWVSSLYKPYPYNPKDGRENLDSPEPRVLRGGSWFFSVLGPRSSVRYWNYSTDSNSYVGFRCALDSSP